MNITWILLTLCVAFIAFYWRILAKTKLKPTSDDFSFTLIVEFIAGIFCLFFIPFFTFSFSLSIWSLGLLLITATCGALGDVLLVYSTKHADISDTNVLLPLNNFYLLVLAAVFLHEPITVGKMIAIILIVFGSILALTKNYKLVVNRGIIAIFIYGWINTLAIIIDKKISPQFSLPLYGALAYLMSSFILFVCLKKNRIQKLKLEFKINSVWSIIIGILWGVFTISLLFAYSFQDASKVIPFARIYIAGSTLYSIFILKEKDRIKQKIIGSIIVTIGAILLAFV